MIGGFVGRADTFFTANDTKYAEELVRILIDANQQVPKALANYVKEEGTK